MSIAIFKKPRESGSYALFAEIVGVRFSGAIIFATLAELQDARFSPWVKEQLRPHLVSPDGAIISHLVDHS